MKTRNKLAAIVLAACLALIPPAIAGAESNPDTVTSATSRTDSDSRSHGRRQAAPDRNKDTEQDGSSRTPSDSGTGTQRGRRHGGMDGRRSGQGKTDAASSADRYLALAQSGVISPETYGRITVYLQSHKADEEAELKTLLDAGVITQAEFSAIQAALQPAAVPEASPADQT